MKCLRFDLWKNYSWYVDGALGDHTVRKVESHLLDCNDCRVRVVRLHDGQRLATQLPRLKPSRDGWGAIEAALNSQTEDSATIKPEVLSRLTPRGPASWQQVLTSPNFAIAIFAVALMVFSAVLLWDKQKPRPLEGTPLVRAFDGSNFRPVLISEIAKNTAPHVVAEGYVTEVKIDRDDGNYKFKLVENIRQSEPFIICEIITPINIEPPTVGSRVRVYGVSRYDAEEGRRWHEVHPVLNIETVKH
jgi:hypothetical protein